MDTAPVGGRGANSGPKVVLTRRDEVLVASEGGRRRAVQIDVPQLTAEERAEWQSAVNESARDCGCGTGAVFMLGAVVGYGLALCFGQIRSLGGVWTHGCLWVLIAFLSAGLGKAVGVTRAGRRYRSRLRELAALIHSRTPEGMATGARYAS